MGLDAALGDQFEYLSLGRNLLEHGQLKFFDGRFGEDVYAYRTPGYPVFVAMCGGNVTVVRVAQALVDTSTVLAIYLLARRFFGARAGLAAGVIVALNPFLIYFTGLILTETLFTAMLAWGMYFMVGRRPLVGLSVLALSVLVRPSAVGLVPLVAALGAMAAPIPGVTCWERVSVGVVNAAMGVLAVVIALFPWAVRNSRHPSLQSWIWTTTNGGITLYDGFHDGATGASDQSTFVQAVIAGRHPAKGPLRGEVARDGEFRQWARNWIEEHPGRSLQLALVKIGRTWSPVPLSSEYGSRLYVVTGLCYTLPLYALVFIGLWRGGGGKTLKALCLLPAIYFTAVHALSVGSLRYRVPCEPPMAVIAGAVLVRCRSARPGELTASEPGAVRGMPH
ncbi:MAG TPA: hypothetical protein VEA69_01735 [Tepidisphaeraceae bacterium]|nr:hypothetical protein [Tepidisphaeraceae bacterium]